MQEDTDLTPRRYKPKRKRLISMHSDIYIWKQTIEVWKITAGNENPERAFASLRIGKAYQRTNFGTVGSLV